MSTGRGRPSEHAEIRPWRKRAGLRAVSGEITTQLKAWRRGDDSAIEPVMPELYAALRQIAWRRLQRESSAVAVDATELVHEALLRVMDTDKVFANRSHFLAVSALYMRSILTDRARAIRARHHASTVTLTLGSAVNSTAANDCFDLVALDDALIQLEAEDERAARVLELAVFSGMSREIIAAELDMSVATVGRDLRFARAWLTQALT